MVSRARHCCPISSQSIFFTSFPANLQTFSICSSRFLFHTSKTFTKPDISHHQNIHSPSVMFVLFKTPSRPALLNTNHTTPQHSPSTSTSTQSRLLHNDFHSRQDIHHEEPRSNKACQHHERTTAPYEQLIPPQTSFFHTSIQYKAILKHNGARSLPHRQILSLHKQYNQDVFLWSSIQQLRRPRAR